MATCTEMPMSFMEALASCVRTTAGGTTYINSISVSGNAEDVSPIACAGGETSDLEAFVVANAFGVDAAGNLAVKFGILTE